MCWWYLVGAHTIAIQMVLMSHHSYKGNCKFGIVVDAKMLYELRWYHLDLSLAHLRGVECYIVIEIMNSAYNWWCHQQTIDMLGKTVNIKKARFNLISDIRWLKHRIECRIPLSKLINMVMSSRVLGWAMITEMYLWVYLYVGCWLAIF